MPRKNAWPSDTWPAQPVTMLSPIAPIAAAKAVAISALSSVPSWSGSTRRASTRAANHARFAPVLSGAWSAA
jgi:hypothetical protein